MKNYIKGFVSEGKPKAKPELQQNFYPVKCCFAAILPKAKLFNRV